MKVKHQATWLSRELRSNQTDAERQFWQMVKNRKFKGYRFLRQHPILYQFYNRKKFFVADFYCRELRLVIEIDGGIHEKQQEYDQFRTEIMELQRN